MIRLAMICRDEAERLPAMAERLEPLALDSVCLLVDDRTTDATHSVAAALWGQLPGGVRSADFTFEDFSQARNELLMDASEDLAPSDYLLLLDPDSLPDGDLPEELTAPAYSCPWRWHGEEWRRTILLRGDTPALYEGLVHECLIVQGPEVHLASCWVDAVVTGGVERLEGFVPLLERDAATSPRSAFYLAQTYQDLGRRDEALCWYLRRAAMAQGWWEETFLATYLAGNLVETLDWEWAEKLWRRAAAMAPRRVEPWYQLARAANARGDHSEALAHATVGLRIGTSTDTLRVNRWIETEGLPAEYRAAAAAVLGMPTPTLEIARG